MSIIEINNLTYSYDKQVVLENINLIVQERDFLAIIGPNGGGKSTLVKAILGINQVKKGKISILGDEPSLNLSKIGYVPQNTNINTNFPIKVIEVVMLGHIRSKEEEIKEINSDEFIGNLHKSLKKWLKVSLTLLPGGYC